MLKRLLAMIALGSLFVSFALADDDVLALVTKGKVTSNSAGVTKLSLEDKMQVKGGYYWTTGLVDISRLTHDNLGNVYGGYVARGTVTPDQTDKFWQKYYFEVVFYRFYDNPRFSNRKVEGYYFIPYDYVKRTPLKTDSRGNPLAINVSDMYKIDPKVYYASKAVEEALNAVRKYQQQVIHGL